MKIVFLDVSETFINSMAFPLLTKYNFMFRTTKYKTAFNTQQKRLNFQILGNFSEKPKFACVVINTAYLQL